MRDLRERSVHAKIKNLKNKAQNLVPALVLAAGVGGPALTTLGTVHAAPPTIITQANPQGWAFADDNGNGGSGAFVDGPGTPPLGSGSAQLDLTAANQGYLFGKLAYGGTKLSKITKLSYSTYTQQGNNTVAVALQLNIDADTTDANTAWQGRLVYEPYYTHTVTDGTWQTWNTLDNATSAGHGNWWFSNGTLASATGCTQAAPCTWASVLTQLPKAGINGGANQGVVFKAGSNWAVPFTGNVDAFTIGITGNDTTFNFDKYNCTTVATSRGSLTAAQVGGNVSGDLDAHGCDIGVYYDHDHQGKVKNASVHDANQYGVFADGFTGNVKLDITNSHIYNIGSHTAENYTPNGVQTGVGVYYNTVDYQNANQPTTGKVEGQISNDPVDKYQKGGIVLNGPKTDADVEDNVVTGAGPVAYIAQNGVQVSRGAQSEVADNTVAANAYTGPGYTWSAGVLIFGGWGTPVVKNVSVHDNKLVDNDIGVDFENYNDDASGPTTIQTRNSAKDNWIFSSKVNNTTGVCNGDAACGGAVIGYQAAIHDVGNKDSACNNTILGPGYAEQGDYDYSGATPVFTQTGADPAVVRAIGDGDIFATTDFNTCNAGRHHNGHYNKNFYNFYHKKFSYWFYR